jgi:dihydroorotate dehydrogenase electron transfer subunit
MLAEQWTAARAAAGDGGTAEAGGGLLLYGARTSSLLLQLEDAPWEVLLATDDGSAGFAGTLVDLAEALALEGRLRPERDALYACGPNAMLAALSRWAGARGFACQVSLETSFGCGFGICAGCAVPVRSRPPEELAAPPVAGAVDPEAGARAPGRREVSEGDAFDRYVFACREGPVFESWRVEWEGVHE